MVDTSHLVAFEQAWEWFQKQAVGSSPAVQRRRSRGGVDRSGMSICIRVPRRHASLIINNAEASSKIRSETEEDSHLGLHLCCGVVFQRLVQLTFLHGANTVDTLHCQ